MTDFAESNSRLALIGISHKTAPLEIREKAAFDASEQANLIKILAYEFNLEGCMIISTCNRSELYFSSERNGDLIHKIQGYLDDFKKAKLFSDAQCPAVGPHRGHHILDCIPGDLAVHHPQRVGLRFVG